MKRRRGVVGFAFLCALALSSCSDGAPPPPPFNPLTTPTDGGGPEEVVCPDEGRPQVSILTPAMVTDPQTEPIITQNVFTVECEPQSAQSLIDPDSVVVEVIQEVTVNAAGETVVTTQELDVNNRGDGVFEASAQASDFENGPITIRCTAEDVEVPSRCGLAKIETFLDLGPQIDIIYPNANPSNAAGGMVVRYVLNPDPVEDPDPGALIASHKLVVAGATIPTEPGEQGGEFDANVDFSDTMLYSRPPNGPTQLSVSATNARGVTRKVVYDLFIDSQGPTIDILAPTLGAIIAGGTTVRATITDLSGVDVASVRFAIDDMFFPMDPVPGTSDFEGTFDANEYDVHTTALVIEVFALDSVGNEGSASVDVKLDIVPPLIDLNPPDVREAKEVEGSFLPQCSALFDPVGVDTINDGEVVGTVPEFRAWIQERTNEPFFPDGVVLATAGVDNNKVKLYILDDESQALVIDTDGNGLCDSINPAFLPDNTLGNDPVVIAQYEPIDPKGAAYFPITPAAFPYDGTICDVIDPDDADEDFPSLVCGSGSALLTKVIPMLGFAASTPGIYGKAPKDEDRCVGDAWDLMGEELTAGWFCAAMEASDTAGNKNVSAPLRVCYVPDAGSFGACPVAPGGIAPIPPGMTCTDGCRGETIEDDMFGPEILYFPPD